MTKTRTYMGTLSVLAATALLAGVAFAVEDAAPALDSEDDAGTAAAAQAGTNETASVDSSSDNNGHGMAVSTLATTTDLTGRAKGEAISALASSNAQNSAAANPEPPASLSATATLATTMTASGRAKGIAVSTSVRASAH